MSLIKVTTIHQAVTNLPKDVAVNDLLFVVGDSASDASAADFCLDLVEEFWGDNSGPIIHAVDEYLSSWIKRTMGGRTMKAYRKEDGERLWGSPIAIRQTAVNAADAATSLPAQVSCALSYHGDLTDIPEEATDGSRPASQRRGRIFVGPLVSTVSVSGSGEPARPADGFRKDLLTAAKRMADHAGDTPGLAWVVVHGVDTDSWSSTTVVDGWVDNQWDTQQRREPDETGRFTFADALT